MNEIKSIKDFNTFDTVVVSTSDRPLPEIIQFSQSIENKAAGIDNHAFKLYWEIGRLKVIEADKPGIVKNPFEEYLKENCYTQLLVLRPVFNYTQKDIKYMLSFVGKMGYDFLGLLCEAIRFGTEWFSKKILGNKDSHGLWVGKGKNPKTAMCGEFCGIVDNHAFQNSDIPEGTVEGMTNELIPYLKLDEITPVDLVLCKFYEHIKVNLDELRKEYNLTLKK